MALLIVWCSDMGKVVFVLLFCLFVLFFVFVCVLLCVGGCMFFYFLFFLGGVEVWVGLFFLKSPGQFISCFFRVTNLSAVLLLYCGAFFFFFCFSMAVGTNLCFCFFPYFSAGLLGNGVHSLASSFILAFSQHCISFNINISWFLLLWQVNIYYVIFTKNYCMYMKLSWLRLGCGGPCPYVFFFHTPPYLSTRK